MNRMRLRLLLGAALALALTGCGSGTTGGSGGGNNASAASSAGNAQEPAKPDAAGNPAQQANAEQQGEEEDAPARAGGPVDADTQPAAGSAQRAAIMDALRPAIERELGGRVEFVVQRADVQDGWALVIAQPQRPGGGAIPEPASWAEEEHDGMDVNAILRFRNNRWTLVDHATGPTDVWTCGLEGPPPSLTRC